MSELINAELTDTEDAGFSRRRVVKGVVWSVPVIVTAIAAPAAAVSGMNATAAFAGTGSTASFVRAGGGGGTTRSGTGPTAFQIHNAGTDINGAISGTINITPVGVVDVGVGMHSMTPATLAATAYSATHAYNASFTGTLVVASGQTANFPIQFQYQSVNGIPNKVTYSYDMTMTVTLPDATSQVMATRLTITF